MILQKLGGDYQLVINKPEDLEHIGKLEEPHWMATSAPIESFTCDPVFLKYLDTDNNNRILSYEVKAGQQWLFRMLIDRSRLCDRTKALHFDAIDVSHEEGKALRAAAERIVANLGYEGSGKISLDDVRSRQKIVASGACNGDGIIPPKSTDDPELTQFLRDIILSTGSAKDANGEIGVTEEHLDKFLTKASGYLEWCQKGTNPQHEEFPSIMIWGNLTSEAYDCMALVQDKVDEFFTLCKLLQVNSNVETLLGITEKKLAEINLNDPKALNALIESSPLTYPNAEAVLAIDEKINPAFRQSVVLFKTLILMRIKPNGDSSKLGLSDWEDIKRLFKTPC